MYFLELAIDYDGTLAHDGIVAPETLAALRRFRAGGRRIILVTGREIPDLKAVMPDLTVLQQGRGHGAAARRLESLRA